jgi:hypothetical protein
MNELEKLLSISSAPFASTCNVASVLRRQKGAVYDDLQAMLNRKNGFTAFECALVVFPTTDSRSVIGLDSWNELNSWRRWYRECIPDDTICFAQDLFGGQFAASERRIIRLDPESGVVANYANSLVEWAQNLLVNYSEDTGWPLAHQWQQANGPISPGQRLLPKRPFILGGDYLVENLTLIDAKAAMENWGRLYKSIQSVPDGQEITISGWLAQI